MFIHRASLILLLTFCFVFIAVDCSFVTTTPSIFHINPDVEVINAIVFAGVWAKYVVKIAWICCFFGAGWMALEGVDN